MQKTSLQIGILSVQGAFLEHARMLKRLGVKTCYIRQKKDLDQAIDGLILPGGESTVMGKLLFELDLFEPIKERIEGGLPVFGTCAGLILLAEQLSNDENCYFATLPVTVKRNAYGRQLGSFVANEMMTGVGEVPMPFIRAPYIEKADPQTEILAEVENQIVAVRYHNQLAVSFHPEVTENTSVHEFFLKMI